MECWVAEIFCWKNKLSIFLKINNTSAQLRLRFASQTTPINAADDPQMGRVGLDVGAVGVGIAVVVGSGVATISRFRFRPVSP